MIKANMVNGAHEKALVEEVNNMIKVIVALMKLDVLKFMSCERTYRVCKVRLGMAGSRESPCVPLRMTEISMSTANTIRIRNFHVLILVRISFHKWHQRGVHWILVV